MAGGRAGSVNRFFFLKTKGNSGSTNSQRDHRKTEREENDHVKKKLGNTQTLRGRTQVDKHRYSTLVRASQHDTLRYMRGKNSDRIQREQRIFKIKQETQEMTVGTGTILGKLKH